MESLATLAFQAINIELKRDHSFPLKLKNCIDCVHALKVISTASLNQSENTVKIVEYVMTNGVVNIFREFDSNSRCKFVISYKDSSNVRFELPNDDIDRHCKRAILLLHSKTQSKQNSSLADNQD